MKKKKKKKKKNEKFYKSYRSLFESIKRNLKGFIIRVNRRVVRNFLGQGRFLQIGAQIFGSSESQSYM